MSDAPESTSPRFLSTHSVSKVQDPLCSEHTLRACPSLVGRKQPLIHGAQVSSESAFVFA